MIPKIIHYCWFGGNPKPQLMLDCIESWKKYCPDYEIREWNEESFDVHAIKYMGQAYDAKKWGFVPDYARLFIVYEYGGIYLDTDVELLRPLDELLELKGYAGFELPDFVNFGLGFGAEKGNSVIKAIMDSYLQMLFINEDGTMNLTPSPILNTPILVNCGLKLNNKKQVIEDITVFPMEYFCPQNFMTGKTKITKNTYSIHHYAASWTDGKKLYKNSFSAWLHTSEEGDYIRHIPNRVLRKLLGDGAYERLKRIIKG